jgi:hypothetical protein
MPNATFAMLDTTQVYAPISLRLCLDYMSCILILGCSAATDLDGNRHGKTEEDTRVGSIATVLRARC